MQEPYLQVTFRRGRPFAAYYYLPRQDDARSARSRAAAAGLVVDYDEAGTPIGVEITAPRELTLEAFNALLADLGRGPVDAAELAPLHAA